MIGCRQTRIQQDFGELAQTECCMFAGCLSLFVLTIFVAIITVLYGLDGGLENLPHVAEIRLFTDRVDNLQ